MTSDYLINVTISTNMCSKSNTVSDERTLTEISRNIQPAVYRVSSLIFCPTCNCNYKEEEDHLVIQKCHNPHEIS